MYKIGYSEDGSLNGYMNFTLSTFDPADLKQGSSANLTDFCRYHDYRYPPDHEKEYQRTEVFWHITAARLAFVVAFQNFVALSVMAIKMVIPNMSGELKERMRREAYLTNEIIIRTELLKAKGQLHALHRELSEGRETIATDIPEENEKRPSIDDPNKPILRSRRMETGDITDGKIVV